MTSAEVQKAVAELGDLNDWVRAGAAERLRAEGKSVFFVLVTVLDSPSSLQRYEAARIIGKIASDLANRPIVATEEEIRRQLPTELSELIRTLETTDKLLLLAVEQELSNHRTAAFPLLLEALRNRTTARADRVIRLLGEWGDLRAVGPLLDAWGRQGSADYLIIVDALRRLSAVAAQHPLELTEAELLRFVIFARQELGTHAAYLGEALCQRAQAAPSISLRAFLPYLKGKWLDPVPESFEKARQAILTATQHLEDLPLPAAASPEPASLPRPAEYAMDSRELPKPVGHADEASR